MGPSCRQLEMYGRTLYLAATLVLFPLAGGWAQESANQNLKVELDAVKTELKATQERVDKLSQQVADLRDAVKEKATAEPAAPKAAPVETPTVAGAEKPTPVDTTGSRSHTVAKGETLTQIAKQYGVTVQEIEQLNKIGDAKKLQAGQTIKIPPAANSASPSPGK
jgi:membrane-bound lytic murein transglycosylase D